MHLLFFGLVFLALNGLAANQEVTLLEGEGNVVLGRLGYLKDKEHRLSLAEVLKSNFIPLKAEQVPSFGFDGATHWFKLNIKNPGDQIVWFLEVGYAPLDEVQIFFKDSSGAWLSKKSGDLFSISSREIPHHHIVFPISLFGSTSELYIRLNTTSSVQLPLTIWSPEKFYQSAFQMQFAHGIFYGIILIMVFYNLFLYFSIRDLSTFYYILTLLAGANVIAFFQGYGFFYLYPRWPALNSAFTILSGPLFIITSGLLTRSFLRLKDFSNKLDQALIATALVTVLLVLVLFIFPQKISFRALHLLTIMNCGLILISAFYCFIKEYRPARYFLLAWFTLLLAGVLFSLKNLGYFPSNALSNSALCIGGIMQTLLISFALGDRINFLTKENQEAKEKELLFKQNLNEQLEKEIKLRTEEIQQTNKELKETNQIKDKLFSVISHDLRGPLHSLKGTLNILRMGALNPEEFNKLTETIEGQLHQTSYLLDNLLQWSKTQMQGESFTPTHIKLNTVLIEILQLVEQDFDQKKIQASHTLQEGLVVFADSNMIRTVLRNLISNALKFTEEHGKIIIDAKSNGDVVLISIEDNGMGIPSRYLKDIFTLQGITTVGTREEKGTGIGLVLCKEFVEKNGGRIWVDSEEGKGSTFYFTVPRG